MSQTPVQSRVLRRSAFGAVLAGLLGGCAGQPPLATVPIVDVDRFMGDWYVIASIPTPVEKGAFNAVESYRRVSDREIGTTFRFNKDDFDGPVKTYSPTGFVGDDPSNAIWGMQFIWPIKADYRIAYLADDYSQTIIGRNRRDYVWVMARTPQIEDADFAGLRARVSAMGYDVSELRRVPQQALEQHPNAS